MTSRRCRVFALAGLLAMLTAALTGIARLPQAVVPTGSERARVPLPVPVARPSTHDVADLSEIRFRREFRVLVPSLEHHHDRVQAPDRLRASHVELIEKFAGEQFLKPVWVAVPRWEDLVPALLRGEGDLVSPRLRISDYRDRGVAFTVPVASVREVLVTRRNDRIASPRDLAGREIALRERSTFWPRISELRREVPSLAVRIIPERLPPESVLQRVASMRYDLAVVDPSGLEIGASRWSELRASPEFRGSDELAFGVHPEADELRKALNDFLSREQLARRDLVQRTEDLDGIRRHGVLRVLTRNNATNYFIWRGRPLGFEYELMRKFAEEQKLTLDMIVPNSRNQLVPELLAGRADVIAAGLADTARRREAGVRFTRPYREVREVVVTRAEDTVREARDLIGRTAVVRRSSPTWSLLESLIAEGTALVLQAAPEELESEDIIERVASGEYDLTVADDHTANVALVQRDDVRIAFELDRTVPIAWAVREQNPKLLAALDAFLDKEYKQTFYNILHARYFENPRTIRAYAADRVTSPADGTSLSPYDEIVRRYAREHGLDWPLVVAVIYRESRFDPRVVSWAGARGLMQLLPATAKRFGVTDLEDPESSIRAGVRLLSWLYGQMEDDLPVKDRTWFALAAYNAGLGHLLDARRLARRLGLDPNRWFGNVEKAMLELSKPRYYRKARHGYVNGIEPVTYVRDVRRLYNAYRSMLRS